MPNIVSILVQGGVVKEVRGNSRLVEVYLINLDDLEYQVVRDLGKGASLEAVKAEMARRVDEHDHLPVQIM